MWAKVAEELQIPWRAAEAMHWQLGEVDMARRAGVVPFSLTSSTTESTVRPQVPGPTAYLQHQNQGTHYQAPSSSRAEYGENKPGLFQPGYQVDSVLSRSPPPPLASVSASELIPTLSWEQKHNYYTTGSSHVLTGTQGLPHPAPPPSPDRLTTVTRPYPGSTELPTCSDSSRTVYPSSHHCLPPKRRRSPNISPPRTKRRRIA